MIHFGHLKHSEGLGIYWYHVLHGADILVGLVVQGPDAVQQVVKGLLTVAGALAVGVVVAG